MSSTEGHHLVKIKLGKRCSAGSRASRAGSCIFMETPSLPTAPLPASLLTSLGSPGGSLESRGHGSSTAHLLIGSGAGGADCLPSWTSNLHDSPSSFVYTLQLGAPSKPLQQTPKEGVQGPLPMTLAFFGPVSTDFTQELHGASLFPLPSSPDQV